jgi:hypothetical protein
MGMASSRSLYIGISFLARFLQLKAVKKIRAKAENEPPPHVGGSSAIAFE